MQTLTRQLLEHTPLDAAQITAAASQLVDPAIESALKADFLRALARKARKDRTAGVSRPGLCANATSMRCG
jgi:hypothetical protein